MFWFNINTIAFCSGLSSLHLLLLKSSIVYIKLTLSDIQGIGYGGILIMEMFLNEPSPASFSFIFVFSNKHNNFYNKWMWNNIHPVGILCWDSNLRPLEHESPPITTRPGLPPLVDQLLFEQKYSLSSQSFVGEISAFDCSSSTALHFQNHSLSRH